MNYYEIHKNKKPKKAKYSSPYTKKQRESIEGLIQDFNRAIEKLKKANP